MNKYQKTSGNISIDLGFIIYSVNQTDGPTLTWLCLFGFLLQSDSF